MTRLVIQLDIPDDKVDPTLTDPLDLAGDIVADYTDWAHENGGIPVDLVAAEWAT
jgi:hypothetical protein